MGSRIYICHTFYHAYIACLKELNRHRAQWGEADLMLSSMSNDFGNLKERAERSGLFRRVVSFDEKEETFFPELAPLKKDTGNLFTNMIQRIRFTRRFGKLLEPYIPVDLGAYADIYFAIPIPSAIICLPIRSIIMRWRTVLTVSATTIRPVMTTGGISASRRGWPPET